MSFAIITEKYSGGDVKTLRSSIIPPPQDLVDRANALDKYLVRKIPSIEKELIDRGLLDSQIPGHSTPGKFAKLKGSQDCVSADGFGRR